MAWKREPLPPVAPGEALLATGGRLLDILFRRPVHVTASDVADAAAIEHRLRVAARDICDGQATEPEAALPDYASLLAAVTDDATQDWLGAAYDRSHGSGEVLAALSASLLVAQSCQQVLYAALAPTRYVTMSSAGLFPASDAQSFRAAALADALADPVGTFARAANGTLLATQAAAIRSCYPTLAAAATAALQSEVIARKARQASWELPPAAEYGARQWLGAPSRFPPRATAPSSEPSRPPVAASAAEAAATAGDKASG